ncbi:alpha/beta hydrolase [Sphingomonas sp.]|uniref:alpha/beta hydrolase family protein n=1 Tax=Sphingomonas sp. TaxID=28214 RepID=UPI001EB66BC9|nr:alpha/beta hydrolase [Sphingomonas sp.]MBX3595829.1 alpha/beta fold hydrolase [Sphingomonas sp.]
MAAGSIKGRADSARLLAGLAAAAATDLVASPAPDGGTIVNGKLEGRAFVIAMPANWTGETVLFGQGYATPGSVPTVPSDPIAKDPGGGTLKHIYGKGLALGIAAFDKSGVATKSGAINTLRLRDVFAKLGAGRQYVVGGSMGGSIVMSLIELYPDKFDGAVSMCGITEGWLPLIGQMADLRAAWNVLTVDTPYALPGELDVRRSGLPVVPPEGDKTPGDAFREAQKLKVLTPVFALFLAAKANPQGKEAQLVRQLAAISGFAPDPAAIGAPLYSAVLGMDDIRATMGGMPVSNRGKDYVVPGMSPAENKAFNAAIQRFDADQAAVAYATKWHQSTGTFKVPLVTVHQTEDALVPYSQTVGLGRVTAKAGNSERLAQYAVPPTRFDLPGGLTGYSHCGFTPKQNIDAFEAMHSWVTTGVRPGPSVVQ